MARAIARARIQSTGQAATAQGRETRAVQSTRLGGRLPALRLSILRLRLEIFSQSQCMLRFARIEQTTGEGLLMTMKYTAGCRFFSVLIGSLTLSASLAMAETVTLDPVAYASA